MQETLKNIVNKFNINEDIISINAVTSGHINDTYLVACDGIEKYILQKLNTTVFTNYKAVIQNKLKVCEHLHQSYLKDSSNYTTIEFIKTLDAKYFLEQSGHIWMLMYYIQKSQVFDNALDKSMVFEAGKLYGDFTKRVQYMDVSCIFESLPEFHSVPLRIYQFEAALKKAKKERIERSFNWIDLVKKHAEQMSKLWKLKEQGALPIRVTHNDTKLSNILFSNTKPLKGLAVIDLDTIMPGLVHFDFGDSIRSICSSTSEDDPNLDNIYLNLDYYEAFCKGFAKETKTILSRLEIKYLPLGAQSIIYIMGLRFLTDYLNQDIYYKIEYENHNLVRASNQFTLFENLTKNLDNINEITNSAFGL